MWSVGNLLLFPAVKNFENPLRIDKVIAMSFVYYCFGGHSVYTGCSKLKDPTTKTAISLKWRNNFK